MGFVIGLAIFLAIVMYWDDGAHLSRLGMREGTRPHRLCTKGRPRDKLNLPSPIT